MRAFGKAKQTTQIHNYRFKFVLIKLSPSKSDLRFFHIKTSQMSLLLKNNVFKPKMLNQMNLAPCHGNPDLGQKKVLTLRFP